MYRSFLAQKFRVIIKLLDTIVEPKNEFQKTENYYREKTFNIFTLTALIITLFNTIFRFFEVLLNQKNSAYESFLLTSTIIFILITSLFIIGKSKFYFLALYIFPFIPLIGIWAFYPIYKNSSLGPNYIELFSINPTLILILGLIVAGLLLSIKEIVVFSILSIVDMFLFYGLTIGFSNEWILPRLIVLILIGAFMIINTFFRLLSFQFLNNSNIKLTKEVEIKQKNLMEERTILYSLISNLKEGVIITDIQKIPTIVNSNFNTFFSEITGLKFDVNKNLDFYSNMTNPFFVFLSKTDKFESSSEIIEIKNKFFLLIGNHIKANSDSKNLGLMIEIHDITDLKIVDMLEKNFRKVIMHELRTPTTSLQLSISNLVKYWDRIQEDDKRKLLKSMEVQTDKFTSIIKKISSLSDLESNGSSEKINIDFSTFFELFKNEFLNKNHDDSHTLILEKAFDDNFLLNIDLKLIFQAVNEVIDNAKKFSSLGSKIFIKFKLENKNLIIEITDQGTGIDELEIPFVFNKFYKGKNGENLSGEGLGLSIAKEIMWLHNGDIHIESKIDNGAKIKFFLPY